MRKKVLVVSDVLPSEKSGGPIVLKRHFDACTSIDFIVLKVQDVIRPIFLYSFFSRLEKTRFRAYILPFRPLYERLLIKINNSTLNQYNDCTSILTVAHGRACFVALKISRLFQVPLITFFHDWYPASSGAHIKLLMFLNGEFIHLYRKSNLAFCVSEQIKKKLGSHPNSHVLYPIPGNKMPGVIKVPGEHKSIHLYYSGFCGGIYRNMLQQIIPIVANNSIIHLYISGQESGELIEKDVNYKNVFIRGFISEESLAEYLSNADILLVLFNFNPEKKLHLSTHFPSKLVDYCQRGRLIIIWGPSYSSAVVWAKRTQAAMVYDQPDASGFINFIKETVTKQDLVISVIENSIEESTDRFDRNKIQYSFEENITKLLNECSK